MERTKIFRRSIIAVVICILLATTVWAADQIVVSYTATLDDNAICNNELPADKTITMTAKINEEVSMDAFTAQVTVPEGWEITGIANSKLNSAEFDFNLANGKILWYAIEGENISNDLLAEVTVKVPADAKAGQYQIKFEIIDISRDFGMPWENGKALTVDVTVVDHAEETVTYTNNGDTHSATYDYCGADYVTNESHTYVDGACICGAVEPVTPTGLKGDVDLDGDVDLADLVLTAKHIGEVDEITNTQSYANADINGDGEIALDDLVKIAQYIGEVIDSL